MDTDLESDEAPAALRAASRVNGNKIFLTRLFFIAFLLFSSHFRVFALRNGLRFKFPLMRRGGGGGVGAGGWEEVQSPVATWIKGQGFPDCSRRTHSVIYRHIRAEGESSTL